MTPTRYGVLCGLTAAALLVGGQPAQLLAQAEQDPRIAQAEAALRSKDYATARPLLRVLSDGGSAGAAYVLAGLDDQGLGGPKDQVSAVQWLTLAAERGDERAMMNLAARYRVGQAGATKDEQKAIIWYDRAVAKGLTTAHFEVGTLLYQKGDFAGAAVRFEKGPDDPGAKACRALMYQKGEHYPRDPAAASRLFKAAVTGNRTGIQRAYPCLRAGATAGNAEAQYLVGAIMASGGGDVKADAAQGIDLLAKAAAQGHPDAGAWMGKLYWTGKGLPRDPAKAFPLNLRAADAGNEQAAYYTGLALVKGEGVGADRTRAMRYFELAGDVEDAGYQRALILVDTDPVAGAAAMAEACSTPAAVEWLRNAATRGLAAAQVRYGQLLESNSCDVEEDEAAAAAWFKKAADQNYAPGLVALGEAYLNGSGVEDNEDRAVSLFRKAADRNDPDAQVALGEYYLRKANFAGLKEDKGREAQLKQQGRAWMEKAVAQGHVGAMKSLASTAHLTAVIYNATMNGQYGGPKPDTWSIMQNAYVEALKYSRMAAARGDEGAKYDVADLLDTVVVGREVPGVTDFVAARRAYLDYLRGGGTNDNAYSALAYMYDVGRGGPVDRSRALFFYRFKRAKYGTSGKSTYPEEQIRKKMTPAEIAAADRLIDACKLADWKNCF